MNVVKIIGGIGNQMYQYAFGQVLAQQGKKVSYDNSWYTTKKTDFFPYPRYYRLDKFQIPDLRLQSFSSRNSAMVESKTGFDLGLFRHTEDHNFYGYWQYYVYYTDLIPRLQKELKVKPDFYTKEYIDFLNEIRGCESVALHVRRGDYELVRKGDFGPLSARYYLSAIPKIRGDLFIFSDDTKWCRDVFKTEYYLRNITFVDLPQDYLCFDLMRLCKHQITSNSTYSIWAGLLNENPDKKVLCPKHFPNDTVENSEKYRYPKEWIKIEDYV